jgi:hypothetical protein
MRLTWLTLSRLVWVDTSRAPYQLSSVLFMFPPACLLWASSPYPPLVLRHTLPGRVRSVPPAYLAIRVLMSSIASSICDCRSSVRLQWTIGENITYIILCCPLRVDYHYPPPSNYIITLLPTKEPFFCEAYYLHPIWVLLNLLMLSHALFTNPYS